MDGNTDLLRYVHESIRASMYPEFHPHYYAANTSSICAPYNTALPEKVGQSCMAGDRPIYHLQ
jgi:hypothetical protein